MLQSPNVLARFNNLGISAQQNLRSDLFKKGNSLKIPPSVANRFALAMPNPTAVPTIVAYIICAHRLHVSHLSLASCSKPCVQLEAFLHFTVRVGDGVRCRSDVTDAFAISRPASHPAVFVAQQFCELAIDVHDESSIGQLAGGDAGCSPFGQFARRFIPLF